MCVGRYAAINHFDTFATYDNLGRLHEMRGNFYLAREMREKGAPGNMVCSFSYVSFFVLHLLPPSPISVPSNISGGRAVACSHKKKTNKLMSGDSFPFLL